LIKKMNRSPGRQLIHNNPKYREKAAELIQDWWHSLKEFRKKRTKSAILIQSHFRGRFVRKYLYDVIYMNYLYFGFCKKIEKLIRKKFGPYFFDCLFSKLVKRKKALKKIISNYESKNIKIYYNKWKNFIRNKTKKNLSLLYLLRKRSIKDSKISNLKRFFSKWHYISIITKERNNYKDLEKLKYKNDNIKDVKKLNNENIKQNLDKIKSDSIQKIKGLLQIINGANKLIKKKVMQIATPKLIRFLKNKIKKDKLNKSLKIRKKKELIILKKYFNSLYEKCFDKEIKNKKMKNKMIPENNTLYNNDNIDEKLEKIKQEMDKLNKMKIELFIKKIEPYLTSKQGLHNLFLNSIFFKIDKKNNILEKYKEKLKIKDKKNKKSERHVQGEEDIDKNDSNYSGSEVEEEKLNKKSKKYSPVNENQQSAKKKIKKEVQDHEIDKSEEKK